MLDKHKAYIRERWEQGCRNSAQIWRELTDQGYKGGRAQVRNFMRGLRVEYGVPTRRWRSHPGVNDAIVGRVSGCIPGNTLQGMRPAGAAADNGDIGPCSKGVSSAAKELRVRQVKWLLARPIDSLSEKECVLVREVCKVSREVTFAHGLVQDFNTIVREQQREHLNSWISMALASGVRELVAFARGLQRDYRAVAAALELPWSQGPVEGQITKLKLLKRQMYGRANFDLLRLRILYPA